MKTAQKKTVSTFSGDPPTENGPCVAAEDEDVNGESVHQVAAKVVENVVRLASQAAQGNSPQSSVGHPHSAREEHQEQKSSAESRGPCLMRLPTIQIDTVPSMPPSPDWSPTEKDAFLEEEEEAVLDESEIEIQFGVSSEDPSEEIKQFAASYVKELISKAMTIAEEKQVSEDTAKAQDVAAQVVDEVITKATETANERLQRSPIVTISMETLEFPIKFSQAPEEMKEFAASYVKDIISKAISMAEEKFVPTVPFNFEDVNLMKTSGPWYIRAREALMRLLRTACFCTPRRNES